MSETPKKSIKKSFASASTKKKALELGLTIDDFLNAKGTGKGDKITMADIRNNFPDKFPDNKKAIKKASYKKAKQATVTVGEILQVQEEQKQQVKDAKIAIIEKETYLQHPVFEHVDTHDKIRVGDEFAPNLPDNPIILPPQEQITTSPIQEPQVEEKSDEVIYDQPDVQEKPMTDASIVLPEMKVDSGLNPPTISETKTQEETSSDASTSTITSNQINESTGTLTNPIHIFALERMFGSAYYPDWDSTLLTDTKERRKKMKKTDVIKECLEDSESLINIDGARFFVPRKIYSEGDLVMQENEEINQLYFAFRRNMSKGARFSSVNMRVSDLVNFQSKLAGTSITPSQNPQFNLSLPNKMAPPVIQELGNIKFKYESNGPVYNEPFDKKLSQIVDLTKSDFLPKTVTEKLTKTEKKAKNGSIFGASIIRLKSNSMLKIR